MIKKAKICKSKTKNPEKWTILSKIREKKKKMKKKKVISKAQLRELKRQAKPPENYIT